MKKKIKWGHVELNTFSLETLMQMYEDGYEFELNNGYITSLVLEY